MSRFLSRAVVAPAPPRPGPGADCLKCKFAVESLHAAVSSPDAITQLIAQADVDIDRQRRIIAECLHPSAAVSQAQRSATDWGKAHLAAHRATTSEAEDRSPATSQGDPEATPAIARAYARQRLGLEMHYKALADAEKRRRSPIEFLYAMQDRRALKQIPDAEIIE